MPGVREPCEWPASADDGRPGRSSAGPLRQSDQNAELGRGHEPMVGTDTGAVARVTSARLIGRALELAAIRAAAAAAVAGHAPIVLIDGDAGIGKSRLIAGGCAQARQDGLAAAVGACVQLGAASVAFSPFLEAFRELEGELGAERFAELAGPAVDLGAAAGKAGPPDPGSLFDMVLSFLIRVGKSQPAMLALEDLHWADAATRDLLAFLARSLRGARIAMVLTYRGDELHRRHPLRRLLDDLERNPRLERIHLAGLSRPELVALLSEIRPTAGLPPADVDGLLARTQGNPFYIEELAATGPLGGPLPGRLSDVILSRVERLARPTAALLRQGTVLADDLDDSMLATITGRPLEETTAAMRDAVAHQFLVIAGRRCRFRHALVREALYEDLLPGERERLHRAAALAMDGSPWAGRLPEHTRWATLAYHWDAARDLPRAFAAAVRAGAAAERVSAPAEAAVWFERALSLWDQVPAPAQAARMSRAQLLLRAAEAILPSLSPHATALAQAALDALDAGAEPEQRAAILGRVARMHWVHHRGHDAVSAYEQAVALLASRPPSAQRALSLAELGQSLLLRSLHRQAETVLAGALLAAREVGALQVEGHALCSLGMALVELGRVADGLSMLRRAVRLGQQEGSVEDVIRGYVNLSSALEFSGRYDAADRTAAQGAGYASQLGHRRGWAFLTANRISVLTRCGRWTQAEHACAELEEHGWSDFPVAALGRLALVLGQGRYDAAKEIVDHLLEATAGAEDVQFRGLVLLRAGELAAAGGRWDDARARLGEALAIARRTDDQFYSAAGYALALRIEASQVQASRARGRAAEADIARAREAADRRLADTRAFASSLAAGNVAELPETSAWLATAAAEHARAWGRYEPDQWAAIAETWEHLGQPAQAATARCAEADATLRARGDRARAATAARAALAVAEPLGATGLVAELRRLAQRGRLDLRAADQTTAGPADPLTALHLTPREAEVLALLAVGRTNREIGRELFISEKTASVHVSNLLRKLGVPNRLEAAAIAHQLALAEPASPAQT
jgi:DNA-binding CsgD family transcriptional regulator/tetratricopeptide (TPR) repeat protein